MTLNIVCTFVGILPLKLAKQQGTYNLPSDIGRKEKRAEGRRETLGRRVEGGQKGKREEKERKGQAIENEGRRKGREEGRWVRKEVAFF